MEFSFKLCLVALLVHYVGIVQLGDEALAEFRNVLFAQGVPLLYFLRGEALFLCFFCKLVYAPDLFGYHRCTSNESWGPNRALIIIPATGRQVDMKIGPRMIHDGVFSFAYI